ncbi:MAG: bifunctional 5,10-methylenetetrahydrofolate dehydrogenase/5,10-methenyltetrahydrofolate cyclohydrolase [Candidatus Desulforudis sp.]|nr:bifunctional 5,10-methylenetetrahydrofolate dehydrogenase/5,10-methenyltetrahydrofolate cyclohydrolase [Desulforudis sp.]
MAIILDGKALASGIRKEIAAEVEIHRRRGIHPRLDAVLVGDDPGSVCYAQAKERVAGEVGVQFRLHHLGSNMAEEALVDLLAALNADPAVHGIMVELPLPGHIDRLRVLESISPVKDVDGVHPINRGRLMSGGEGLYPATPLSCLEILGRYGIKVAGMHAVIVGRGETVGKPLFFLLLRENATVTVCHTRTVDLPAHTVQADLLVVAAGRPRLIRGGMVKPGAVVVDAGTNPVTGGGICGDVDFGAVREVAGAITPVPGGVGSMTTTMVMKNLLRATKLQLG